jgi:phosphopantothenoylcysteine decarboxylase/phosphopantothenate--cysteine ligase
VANDVGSGGIGCEDNRVHIINRQGGSTLVQGKKSLIARKIVDSLVEVL